MSNETAGKLQLVIIHAIDKYSVVVMRTSYCAYACVPSIRQSFVEGVKLKGRSAGRGVVVVLT